MLFKLHNLLTVFNRIPFQIKLLKQFEFSKTASLCYLIIKQISDLLLLITYFVIFQKKEFQFAQLRQPWDIVNWVIW